MKTIYRVNQIKSERAVIREGLDHPTVEKHIGDYGNLEEAMEVYSETKIGTEVDKEILKMEEKNGSISIGTIETTY